MIRQSQQGSSAHNNPAAWQQALHYSQVSGAGLWDAGTGSAMATLPGRQGRSTRQKRTEPTCGLLRSPLPPMPLLLVHRSHLCRPLGAAAALCCYLAQPGRLHQLHSSHPPHARLSTGGVAGPSDLLAHMLIDAAVSACLVTGPGGSSRNTLQEAACAHVYATTLQSGKHAHSLLLLWLHVNHGASPWISGEAV